MTFPDKILISLYNSKHYSCTLLDLIVARDRNGEDDIELQNKFILLGEWIRILQNYYDTNFDSEGNVIVPDYPCFTAAQAENLMAKLKLAIGNNTYPIDLFSLGIWMDDSFYFNDSDVWSDFPPLN